MTRRYQRRRNRRIRLMKRCAVAAAALVGVILIAYLANSLIGKIMPEKITLEGHWRVNGEGTNLLHETLLLNNDGTANVEGLSASWYHIDDTLHLKTIFGSYKYHYFFSGNILTLEDEYGDQRTYTNTKRPSPGKYKRPEATEQEARNAIGYGEDRDALILLSHQAESDWEEFIFSGTTIDSYGQYTREYRVNAIYNEEYLLWDYHVEKLGKRSEIWNIPGTWKSPEGDYASVILNISDFNASIGKISCTYKYMKGYGLTGPSEISEEKIDAMMTIYPDEYGSTRYSLKIDRNTYLSITSEGVFWDRSKLKKLS